MLSGMRRIGLGSIWVLIGVLLASGCLVSSAFAQEEAQPPEEDVGLETEDPAADDEFAEGEEDLGPEFDVDGLLAADEDVLAGSGYSYDPQGRRDPFVSLAERRRDQDGGPTRPPGVPGLLIDEVDLKGLFEIGGEFVAQIQAADSEKSFLLHAGDQLFDGQVVRITMSEVVFKQVVNDPGILKPFREVVKKLNP